MLSTADSIPQIEPSNDGQIERTSFAHLVSPAYSGSTLLAMLLNAHPNIVSVGELQNVIGSLFRREIIDEYPCSCGAQIRQCSFWLDVQRRCAEQGVDLNLHDFKTGFDAGLGPHVDRMLFGATGRLEPLRAFLHRMLWLWPAYRYRILSRVKRNVLIAQTILEIERKDVFFDASKLVGRALVLSRCNQLDFKLVHLTRDPRGVLSSNLKHHGEGMYKKALANWKRTHLSALRLRDQLADENYVLVHYEELCTNPVETLGKVCRCLGVGTADLVHAVETAPHHIIGNNMRCRPFLGLRLDESWQDRLGPEHLAACRRITGDVANALGYE